MQKIQLPFVKRPRTEWVDLAFSYVQIAHRQKRLQGRMALSPVIDLGDFRCQAVIDRVIVRFSIARPTQAAYLCDQLSVVLGIKKTHCEPVGCSPLRLISFDLTVQEASAAMLLRIEDYLLTTFGLTAMPDLQLLEISIDFWPERASDDEKMRLIGVLQRCYLPQADIWSQGTRPRIDAGRQARGRRFLLPQVDGSSLLPAQLKVLPVDGTYYLGARDGDWMIRLMHKQLDDQNPAAGTRTVLGPDQQRVRMEVVLKWTELKKLGLVQPRDLIDFKFARLQGDQFRFMLPTFRTPEAQHRETLIGAMQTWMDSHLRAEIFMKAGLIGLEAERRARVALREQNSQQIRSARKRLEVTSRMERQGSGVQAHYVAYEEMNQMIQRALEGLQKREATKLRGR